MGDKADGSLDLLVSIKSDTAGAKTAEGALREVVKTQEDAKAGITDGLNPALEGFSRQADKAAGSSHDLHSAINGLKSEFPELGRIGRMALNPISISVFAVTAAFKMLQSAWDSVLERMNTGTGGGNFRSGIEGLRKAALESALAFEQYKRALEGAATAEASMEEKSQKATAAIRAKAVAAAESQDAHKALDLARINLQEAQGRLSGPEAIIARVRVEDKYAQDRVRQNLEARQKEVEEKKRGLDELRLEAYNAEQSVEPLRKQADEAATALSRNENLLAESKKTKVEVDKQVKALANPPFLGPGMLEQGRAAEALQSQVGVRIRVLEDDHPVLADQAKAAAERYEAAKSRALRLRGAATNQGRDLPGLESDVTQLHANENAIFRTERLSRNIAAGTQLANEKKQGDDRIDELKRQMIRTARSGGPITDEAINVLRAQEAHNVKVAKELAEQSRRIHQLEGRPPRTY